VSSSSSSLVARLTCLLLTSSPQSCFITSVTCGVSFEGANLRDLLDARPARAAVTNVRERQQEWRETICACSSHHPQAHTVFASDAGPDGGARSPFCDQD
jgi:hypothetical protein